MIADPTAAAPAFAQTEAEVEQEAEQFGVVDDSVCSQVYNIAVQQYNAGDQTAVADADAFADADATAGPFGTAAAVAIADADAVNIANAAGIDVDTVNVCLNNFATVTVTPTAKTVHAKKTVTPKATTHAKKVVWIKGKKFWVVDGKTVTATAKATATATKTLPETGGASLLALGAGALLVGGGLVARRIAR